MAFGSTWLTPRIREFLDLYPEIQVTLVVDDSELDLSMREADVAIRMSPPRQPDLIQRHLVSVPTHVYAAPEYIKKHGMPQKPEDLDKHRLIVYGEDSRPPVPNVNWLLEAGTKPGQERKPILAVNNFYGDAARCDQRARDRCAVGFHSERAYRAGARPARAAPGRPYEAYFVYPEELRTSKRISVFRDFLLRKVAETPAQLTYCAPTSHATNFATAESIAVFADEPEEIPAGDRGR